MIGGCCYSQKNDRSGQKDYMTFYKSEKNRLMAGVSQTYKLTAPVPLKKGMPMRASHSVTSGRPESAFAALRCIEHFDPPQLDLNDRHHDKLCNALKRL